MLSEHPSQHPPGQVRRPSVQTDKNSGHPFPLTIRKSQHPPRETREKTFLIDAGEASIGSDNHTTGINEDYGYVDATHGLLLTADGLGSGPAPHLASRRAADIIRNVGQGAETDPLFSSVLTAPLAHLQEQREVELALSEVMFQTDTDLRHAVEHDPNVRKSAIQKFRDVHQTSFNPWQAEDREALTDMVNNRHATTQIIAKFWKNTESMPQISIAWVGDSRLYRFRHGELEQLTKDDSVLQVCLEAGLITKKEFSHLPNLHTAEVMKRSEDVTINLRNRTWLRYLAGLHKDQQTFSLEPFSNMVINTLGGGAHMKTMPHIRTLPVETDDIYIGVSDGVTVVMSDHHLTRFMKLFGTLPAQDLAQKLKSIARLNAERKPYLMDDITVTCMKMSHG